MGKGKNRVARSILDREMERSFFHLIPELPGLVQKLVVQVENFDGSQPKTFLAEIEGDWGQIGERIRGQEARFHRFFLRLLGKFTAKILVRRIAFELVRIAKNAAASDKRYSLLLKLMHEVDQKVPFASVVVAYPYAEGNAFYYADHKAFFVAQATAFNCYKQAERASGEARGCLAVDAFAKTVELVYKPYLTGLWFLSYFKVGKPLPAHVPELGSMLQVILDRLPEYRGLVEPDAIWMRNSAVHNGPDYILGEDSVWMWDRKHCRKKVHVDELIALTRTLYLISTQTVQGVSQLYMFREVLLQTGVVDLFADCMTHGLAGDEFKLNEAEARMKTHWESLFEPLQRFLDQSKRAA